MKLSDLTLNEEFELLDGSYSVSDNEDNFQHIIRKHDGVADNPLIRIYVNKMELIITFKMKTGYQTKRILSWTN